MAHPDSSGVVLPPPVIYSLFLVAGVVLDRFWPVSLFEPPVQIVAGAALLAVAILLFLLSLRELLRARTSVDVRRPTTALVTSGPFRLSRNPIYVGLNLFYLGLCVMGDLAWSLLMGVPAFLVLRYSVVSREERYLEEKFGDAYRRYRSEVRRWV